MANAFTHDRRTWSYFYLVPPECGTHSSVRRQIKPDSDGVNHHNTHYSYSNIISNSSTKTRGKFVRILPTALLQVSFLVFQFFLLVHNGPEIRSFLYTSSL